MPLAEATTPMPCHTASSSPRDVADARPVPVPLSAWLRALDGCGLPRGVLATLRALVTWMDADGSGACPGLDSIARASAYSRSSVCEHLRAAEHAGWLLRQRSKGGTSRAGRGITSRYTAVVPTTHPLAERWRGASHLERRRGRRQPSTTAPPELFDAEGQLSSPPDTTGPSPYGSGQPPSAPSSAPLPATAGSPTGGSGKPDRSTPARATKAAWRLVDTLITALPDRDQAAARADEVGRHRLARTLSALAEDYTPSEIVSALYRDHPLCWPSVCQHPAGLLRARAAKLATAIKSGVVEPPSRRRRRQRAEDTATAAAAAVARAEHVAARQRTEQLRAWWASRSRSKQETLVEALQRTNPLLGDIARQRPTIPGVVHALYELAATCDHHQDAPANVAPGAAAEECRRHAPLPTTQAPSPGPPRAGRSKKDAVLRLAVRCARDGTAPDVLMQLMASYPRDIRQRALQHYADAARAVDGGAA